MRTEETIVLLKANGYDVEEVRQMKPMTRDEFLASVLKAMENTAMIEDSTEEIYE